MKKDSKITLAEFKNRMQQRNHYPNVQAAFNTAFGSWRAYCGRHSIHEPHYFTTVLERGWLKRSDANLLWWYIFGENKF